MSDTIPQLGDPFSAAASDQTQPGMLGQSPAFWQHLAMFGGNLAAAANARTADGHLANGSGFAGPFGAAIGATAQDAQRQAQSNASIGRTRAETVGQGLQNRLTASGIPLAEAQNQMLMRMYQNPDLINQIQSAASGTPYGGSAGGALSGYGAAPGANSLAPVVNQLESGGRNVPGIVGDGSAAGGPMQVHQGAITDYNRAHGSTITLAQATADPNVGSDVGKWYLDKQVQQFGPTMGLAAYNAGPGRVGQAVQSGQGMAALPPSTQNYVQRGMQIYNGIDPAGGIQKANQLMQQAAAIDAARMLKIPGVYGDPAILRQQAQDYTHMALAAPTAASVSNAQNQSDRIFKPQIEGAVEGAKLQQQLQLSPEIKRQEAIAETGVKPQIDRFGNMYGPGADGKPQLLGRGSEVKETYNPATGNYEWGDVGALGIGRPETMGTGNAAGSGGTIAKPGPGKIGNLEAMPQIAKNFIEHDNKMVDEDLAHVIENVTPAKQALFQLRSLNPDANTGAAGDLRTNFKNWVQEFAPDFVSQLTGDASPAQEFKKIALMGAGKQERGDLGARGGFRAIEMYANANPNLENTPTANHDMANALLISHQYHEDYAQGATGFFNNQVAQVQKAGSPEGYQKLSNYDKEFIGKMRPELYANAISAINGKPSTEWAKGLTPKQVQIVGGVLQRADPTATVDMNGHQVPVNAFKTTIGPQDIMSGAPGGG